MLEQKSELNRAEEAPQSDERSLSLIINAIPTFVWSARPDGYCDFLKQRWLDNAGMTALEAARSRFEELLGRHLLAFADHAAEFYAGPGNDRGKPAIGGEKP
jgi:hypothetical protein